ncbi:hypothetical protein BGZ46_007937 [Entomortierella lignicola]|nr:hypothetical protein BGZ46_007937 [Entomortierella lignicola]
MAPPLYTCRQTYFQRAYYKLSHISKSNVHVHSTDSSITRATSTRFTQTSRIWANSSFTRSFSLSHPHSFRHSHPSFKKPKQQQESPLNSLKTYQLNILIDGRSPSDAFSVSVKSTDTVSKLKKLIKAAKAPEFNGIVAKRLSLWSASIPTDRKRRIILSALGLKLKKEIKKLDSTVRISDIEAFGSGPPKGTIHTIIVEIPSGGISLDYYASIFGSF